jgi:hypothetical protein
MNIKYKLLIIAGALGVAGAAVASGLYCLPGPDFHTWGCDAQLSYFLVCTVRHDNDGIERGLQSEASRRSDRASSRIWSISAEGCRICIGSA